MEYIPLQTPPDRRKYPSDVDGITTKINDRDSFLSAFTEICRRRNDTDPVWKNATYSVKNRISGVNQVKDLLLEASGIDYITAKDNATEVWLGVIDPNDAALVYFLPGNDKRKRLHMRKAFAEFIYNCLSNELGNKIRDERKKNKIHYDGPMVWLTLMNELFSTNNGLTAFMSSMETCLTNMTIVNDNHLEYSLKI
jgi:hypothetical protein